MDKKIGYSILFSLFVLVFLFGLTKVVVGSIDSSLSSVVSYGEIVGNNDTMIRGGVTETFNVTVAVSTTDGSVNYSNITIDILGANNNLTFTGEFVAFDESEANENGINGSVTNATFYSGTADVANWECLNTSQTQVACSNLTATDPLGGNGSSLTIRFNVTSVSGVEAVEYLNVSVDDSAGTVTSTLLPVYVDGVSPRVIDVNVTDGNVTWLNSSDQTKNYYEVDANKGSLTVYADIQEMNFDSNAYIIFSTNGSNVTRNDFTWTSMTQDKAPGLAENGVFSHTFSTSGYTNPITLMFVFNDTYNQETEMNASTTTPDPMGFWANDTLVKVNKLNATTVLNGKTTTISSPGSIATAWVGEQNITMDIEIAGEYKGGLLVYVNTTGAIDEDTQPDNSEWSQILMSGNLTDDVINTNITSLNGAGTSIFQTDMNFAGNDTNNVYVAVVVNSTNSEHGNDRPNDLQNYTSFAVYNFRVDGSTPTPTVTGPNDPSVTISDTTGISYTCTTTEAGSGVYRYTWTLTKPGGTVVTYTDDTSETSKARSFSGSDINTAGTHTVGCRVMDGVGNIATSADSTFSVTYQTTSSSSGGGGSSTGATSTVSFDVDFSEVTTGSIKAQQGLIKSFSFDGNTKHTITFDKVTASSATVTIASNPITVTLNLGETKEVDINLDGVNDVKVKLKSVVNGLADVEISKIEAGAQVVAKEERAAAGIPEAEPTPSEQPIPQPVSRSNAGLWITLLVVLAVVVIGYLSYRKK